MGIYINRGNSAFRQYTNGEYVDKTAMIAYINTTVDTANKLTCVSRPRRFGKSMAAQMLYAYFDKSCDSHELFSRFAIAKDKSFEQHLNKYPTISIDITSFTTRYEGRDDIVELIQVAVIKDIRKAYPDVEIDEGCDLMDVLLNVNMATGEKFVMIIDEWDALCREAADKPRLMNNYVNLLRRLFKNIDTAKVFACVYMTGILPIKRYGTQSALNDFREYSMTDPKALAEYFGFTTDEVKALCGKYHMDFDEVKSWYDGYRFSVMRPVGVPDPKLVEISVFNPNSVMQAVDCHQCNNYWVKTSSFDSLQRYIDMDFTGVKEAFEKLLNGGEKQVNTLRYGTNLYDVENDDELFTLLIHLGYVAYDMSSQAVRLPNMEVRIEITEAVRGSKSHPELARWVKDSDLLLDATLAMDEDYVAKAIETFHNTKTAPTFYNNEQALRSVIRMAYIGAVDYYVQIEELPTGKGRSSESRQACLDGRVVTELDEVKGFADVVFIPKRSIKRPAIVVEMKWNHPVEAAIDQIKERNYPDVLKRFTDNILLVGISYDETTKQHTCKIER